jgi:hypothetical protein
MCCGYCVWQRWINGSRPYQVEDRQRGPPVRSLAVTWGRGPAPALLRLASGPEWWQWTLKPRFYGQVSILRLMNAELCRSNLQIFFGKLLGFGKITIAGLSYDHHRRGFLVERTRTRKHQV